MIAERVIAESRTLRTVAWLCLAVALAAVAAGARAEDQTWHAETLTTSPGGLRVTQYWSKGNDKFRAETVVAGQRLVTLVNGGVYYAINATQGQALAIERSARAQEDYARYGRLLGLEGFVIRARGGEKVKAELLAGRMCDVYRMTDSNGRRAVWVEQDRGEEMVPLRVEMYSRQAAAEISTNYVQWAEGLDLPERLFVPDPRFRLMELSYDDYLAASNEGEVSVPVLHGNLLHGER